MPRHVVEAAPWLLYWLGMALVPFDPRASRSEIERSLAQFEEEGDAAGAYLAWAAGVQSYIYEWVDFTAMEPWLAAFERLRARHPELPGPVVESRVAHAMYSVLLSLRPDHPAAAEWEERALAIALGPGPPPLRIAIGSFIVGMGWYRGETRRASRAVEVLGPLSRSRGLDPSTVIMWRVGEAAYYANVGPPERACQVIREGLALAEETGIRVWDVPLHFWRLTAALVMDDHVEAASALDGMRGGLHDPARLIDMATYDVSEARVALRLGNLEEAAEWARRARDLFQDAGFYWARAGCALTLARALLGLGALEEAGAQITAARQMGVASRSSYFEYLAGLLEALLFLARGEEPAAIAALQPSFATGREKELSHCPMLSPTDLGELCALALERDVEPDYARHLVRLRRLPAPPRAGAQWPWALRVRTLGGFEVERDGAALQFGRQAASKPLQLLQALVALGPGPVHESRLAGALWPDADGDAALRALQTTLYRLRKLLPDVLLHQNHKLSLDPERCFTDVDAIGCLARRVPALSALPWQAPDRVVALAEEALSLYRGQFLPGEEERPWTLRRRRRTRRTVLCLVSLAAERLRAAGLGDAARELEERAARADPRGGTRRALVSA